MGKVFKLASEGADAVARDFVKVGAAGEKMEKALTQGARSVPPALRAIDTAAAEAKSKVEGLAGSTGSLGKIFTSMGPVGLAAAASLGLVTGALTALQAASKGAVDDMLLLEGAAKQAGVSVEFLQSFRASFVALGRDVGMIEPALKTFNVRLGEIRNGLGEGQLNLLAKIGITPEDVAQFANAEDGLLKIADALAKTDEATRRNIADKLGIGDLIPLLERGGDGIRKMQAEAVRAGVVLDESVVSRAAETARQWKVASNIIDTQFKRAAIDASPFFEALATTAAAIATHLGDAYESLRKIGDRQSDVIKRETESLQRERAALTARFQGQDLSGGNANSTRAEFASQGNVAQVAFGQVRIVQGVEYARDRLARLNRDITSNLNELALRSVVSAGGAVPERSPPPSDPAKPPGGGATVDAERTRLEAYVKALDAAEASAVAFAAAQARMVGATREEVEAALALEVKLADLDAARAKGVITSDEELARLKALVTARYAETKSERDRDAARAKVKSLLPEVTAATMTYAEAVASLEKAQKLGAITAQEYAAGMLKAKELLRTELGKVSTVFVEEQTRIEENIGGYVGDVFDTLEDALRSGAEVSGEDAKQVLAQFLRDVLYDAIVGTALDDLEALAVAKLKAFFKRIFKASTEGEKGGKGGKSGLVDSLLSAVFSGFGGGGGGGKGASALAAKIGGFSSGGDVGPGLAWVGENGRELVDFKQPAHVYDSATSFELLRKTQGGAAPQFVFAPVNNIAPGVSAEAVAELRAVMSAQQQEFRNWAATESARTVATMTEAKRRRYFK